MMIENRANGLTLTSPRPQCLTSQYKVWQGAARSLELAGSCLRAEGFDSRAALPRPSLVCQAAKLEDWFGASRGQGRINIPIGNI